MADVTMRGWDEFFIGLDEIAKRVDSAPRTALVDAARVVEREAKNNFEGSHRPGEPHVGGNKPDVVSGMLRRSIRVETAHREGRGVWFLRVGPTAPYGRRIERGFVGVDSLGRRYNQRPFPYLHPALRKSVPAIRRIYERAYAKAMKRD